jgi:hypothetical protein
MTSVNGNELRVEEVPVDLDLGAIEDLQQRLSRWQRARDLGHDWECGTPTTWIAELLNDWSKFDVEAPQGRLDALTHYRTEIEDQRVHVVRVVGSGSRPLPLLLTHGWPGSFLEYLKLIPLLTDPEAHGADPIDPFTLIIPSLPGSDSADHRPSRAVPHETWQASGIDS